MTKHLKYLLITTVIIIAFSNKINAQKELEIKDSCYNINSLEVGGIKAIVHDFKFEINRLKYQKIKCLLIETEEGFRKVLSRTRSHILDSLVSLINFKTSGVIIYNLSSAGCKSPESDLYIHNEQVIVQNTVFGGCLAMHYVSKYAMGILSLHSAIRAKWDRGHDHSKFITETNANYLSKTWFNIPFYNWSDSYPY